MQYDRILPAALMLLAAACVDDPMAVEDREQPIERADHMSASAQAQDGEDVDSFRTRLQVDFRVVGGFTPNSPITVHLEGVAVETILGGTVEVELPTFAAMKLAGPDKRLRYKPTGKPPVVARWNVPPMEVGDTWKQTLDIGRIVEKGYYQVTAIVRTEGTFESPYVFDSAFREAWLLIADDGGRLTTEFDETIFPSRILPQPGPFVARLTEKTATSADMTGTGASAAGASTAASSSNSIYVHALHRDRRYQRAPLVGAKVIAEYYTSGGQRQRSTIRYVPSSGYVKFPCPDAHIVGTAENPTTLEVEGGQRLAHWQARSTECGDTIQFFGARHYYLPWSYLDEVAPVIERHFGYYRGRARWRYVGGKGVTSYDKGEDMIKYREYYDIPWTSAHEFTHSLHHKRLGGIWSAGSGNIECWNHKMHKASSYKCALKEGLANYGADIATGITRGERDRRARPPYWTPAGREPGEIEGNVTALFHDLVDDTNESDDETTYPAYYVMTVFKTCENSGGDRNDVADFVWCLENRVDDDEHEDHFSKLSTPSSPRESASEPDDWNADDIRSTWHRNVG